MRTPILLLAAALAAPAAADGWNVVSGPGTAVYLAAGVGLPLLEGGRLGRERAFRVADAGGVSVLLAYGLKAAIRERRPDGSDHGSFPSAHAAAAFAVAAMQSQFHPREAPFWFAGAALIGASRIAEHKHYLHDVLAGGALGYGVARLELSLPRGLVLRPFIGEEGRAGLALGGRF